MPDNYRRKPATIEQVQDAWARQYTGFLDRLAWHAQYARIGGAIVPRRLRRWDAFWADRKDTKSPRERWQRLCQRVRRRPVRRSARRNGCGMEGTT